MRRIIPALLFSALASTGFAASVTTETFNAGANGWAGTVNMAGTWSFAAGNAQVTFFDTGFPIPDEAMLTNQPGASSGSFIGNFVEAGIELIGIRFQAVDALPSDIQLSFRGGTSVYQRSFSIAQTGAWHTLAASLADAELGGWTNLSGNLDGFQAALTDVKSLSVRIVRSGQAAQSYLIDELFLDYLPAGASIVVTGDEWIAQWDRLRPSASYVVEGTTNLLTTPWLPLAQFIATNQAQALTLPSTNTPQFLRLATP